MRRKVYLRLEVLFLILWWLALLIVVSAKMGGPNLISVHPAKLLVLPAALTTLFGHLARKEKRGCKKNVQS